MNSKAFSSFNFSLFSVLLMFIVLGSNGCSFISGNVFAPIAEIPKDRAIVYFYRTYIGRPNNHTIKANGNKIAVMKRGGYYPFIATPGAYEFSSKPRFKLFITGLLDTALSTVTLKLEVEAGKVYYIKGVQPEDLENLSVATRVLAQYSGSQALLLIHVDNESGASEIQGCVLLKP